MERPNVKETLVEAGLTSLPRGTRALGDWALGWQRNLRNSTRRAARSGADPHKYHRGNAPTAVLLPGVWGKWESLENWARALHAAGWSVRFIPQLDHMLGPLTELSTTLDNALQELGLEDVVLVAHSKGGLVGKQTLVGPQSWRIRQLITFGTPYQGAPLAALSPQFLQMQNLLPGTPELVALEANTTVNTKIVSVQATWDQNVPPKQELPGAQELLVNVQGHNALLVAPEAIGLLVTVANEQV